MSRKRTSLDSLLEDPAEEFESQSKTGRKLDQNHLANPAKEQLTKRRPGIKQPALYLKNPVHKQLKLLAFEEDKKMHDLFLEAIDMLLADRGLPSIRELEVE